MAADSGPGEELRYQPFYCEENVWWLARRPELASRDRWAVFISNPDRTCALWQQRLSASREEAVVWDYHVVLLTSGPGGPEVWDLDSRLPKPTSATNWLEATFPVPVPEPLAPRFRVVSAAELGAGFASDRRHMRDPKGEFRAPPPPWPAIVSPTGALHTLDAFVDVLGDGPGSVLDAAAFRRWVTRLVESAG